MMTEVNDWGDFFGGGYLEFGKFLKLKMWFYVLFVYESEGEPLATVYDNIWHINALCLCEVVCVFGCVWKYLVNISV